MKKLKAFAALLMSAAVLILLPETNTLTAKAEEPVTYNVKYVSDELGWRFLTAPSTFEDGNNGRELYYLMQWIKDGDAIVVYNEIGTNTPLDLGNVNLGNLTYMIDQKWSIVYAGSVKDCYVLGGSGGTVNCDVENAYVYDTVVFNFNNNVKNLYMTTEEPVKSVVGCSGTVDYLLVTSKNDSHVMYEFYDFEKNSLAFSDGAFKPNGGFKTPQEHAAAATPEPQATNPQTPEPQTPDAAGQNQSVPSSSDEYDDVPKTGQSFLYMWFLGAAALCFAGSLALRQTRRTPFSHR